METTDKSEQQKKQAPIVDGDARPDRDPNQEDKIVKNKSKKEKKTTPNRVDRNSLEDFRDAR